MKTNIKKIFFGIFVVLAIFATGIALTACNNGEEPSISVSTTDVTLPAGESVTLTYYASPSSMVVETAVVGEKIFEYSLGVDNSLVITALENEERTGEISSQLILTADGYDDCEVVINVTVIYPEKIILDEDLPEEDENKDLDEEKGAQDSEDDSGDEEEIDNNDIDNSDEKVSEDVDDSQNIDDDGNNNEENLSKDDEADDNESDENENFDEGNKDEDSGNDNQNAGEDDGGEESDLNDKNGDVETDNDEGVPNDEEFPAEDDDKNTDEEGDNEKVYVEEDLADDDQNTDENENAEIFDNEETGDDIVDGNVYLNLTTYPAITQVENTLIIPTSMSMMTNIPLSFAASDTYKDIKLVITEVTLEIDGSQYSATGSNKSYKMSLSNISEFAGSEGVLTVYFTIDDSGKTLTATYTLIFE